MEVALAWAVSAKKLLQNVYGYSPNQSVFGKNPSFPTVLNNDPPAIESSTASEVVPEHLMHYMQLEKITLLVNLVKN